MSQSASASAPLPVVAAPNPFRGLNAFQESDAHLFYGRNEQTDDLLRRLSGSRFLAVVGTSASGKSSLVRAGLLPGVKRGFLARAGSRWRVAVMRPFEHPTARPIQALDACLAAPAALGPDEARLARLQQDSLGLVAAAKRQMKADDSLMIVVDQFEEIFRFRRESSGGEDEADAFVKLLLTAVTDQAVSVYVVLTMRSDYLGQCALFTGLPEVLNRSQYLVPTLTRRQVSEVITGPVHARGVEIAPALLQRALNDVENLGHEFDRLPVLQHVLKRIWQAAQGAHELTLEHYAQVGGMSDALNSHAESLFHQLGEAEQAATETMFRRLTEKNATSSDLRRPTTFGELRRVTGADKATLGKTIVHFAEFLTFPEPAPPALSFAHESVVDLTHESLIRRWHRLQEWVLQEHAAAAVYRRVVEDATQKKRAWVDPDLAQARTLSKQTWGAEWATRYSSSRDEFRLALTFLTRSHRLKWLTRTAIVLGLAALAAVGIFMLDERQQRRQVELIAAQRKEQLDDQAKRLSDLQSQRDQASASLKLFEKEAQDARANGNADLARQFEANANLFREQANKLQADLENERKNRVALTQQAQQSAAQLASASQQAGQLAAAKDQIAALQKEKQALEDRLTTADKNGEFYRQRVQALEANTSTSKPRTIAITLDEIETVKDGSGGTTGWVFQAYVDNHPLLFLPKRDYTSDKGGARWRPNLRDVVTLDPSRPVRIRVAGQRTFGNDTVSGEESLDLTKGALVEVTSKKRDDGDFRFRFSVGPP